MFRIGNYIRFFVKALSCSALAGALLWGQSLVPGQPPVTASRLGGVQLYSITASSTYVSQGIPPNLVSSGLFAQSALLGYDVFSTGGASMGWSRPRPSSTFSVIYSPSYTHSARNAEWSNWNHSLSLSGLAGSNMKLSRRWSFSYSLNASQENFQNFVFAPSKASSIVSSSATFNDLAAGMLRGDFTNSELAAILTGGPQVDTSLRRAIYGERLFTASLGTTLSYARSQRMMVSVSLGGGRNQPLSQQVRDTSSLNQLYLRRQTTAAFGSVAMSYSLSPRTAAGLSVITTRGFGKFLEAYTTSATASLGRTMGRHWFLTGNAGSSLITPVSAAYTVPSRPTWAAGGGIGYKVYAHTLVASANRGGGDPYGLSAGSTISSIGAWNWARPGRTWSLGSGFGYQRFVGGSFGNQSGLEGWNAYAVFSRALSRSSALNTNFSHIRYSGLFYGAQPLTFSINAVQLSVVWAPGLRL